MKESVWINWNIEFNTGETTRLGNLRYPRVRFASFSYEACRVREWWKSYPRVSEISLSCTFSIVWFYFSLNTFVLFTFHRYLVVSPQLPVRPGSIRPNYLFAPDRFTPLNRYYIIIDEVFFDNFVVIIYLLVVYKKKEINMIKRSYCNIMMMLYYNI
jgi:hypothetical protein